MDSTVKARKPTKGERTKERILRSALDLFSEQGFAATSVRDIAARAEITHVGLMHHFRSKDDMLVRILEYRETQDKEAAVRFADYGLDHLFAWIIEIVRTNAAEPERVRLFVKLSAEATDEQHPARAYFVRRYANVLDAIERAFAEHFAASAPSIAISPRDAARSIVALMDGLQLQLLLGIEDLDMTALVRAHLTALGVTITDPEPTPGETTTKEHRVRTTAA